jgi:hypothetical protein
LKYLSGWATFICETGVGDGFFLLDDTVRANEGSEKLSIGSSL